jgi:DNA mismatch repair ATPase MutS
MIFSFAVRPKVGQVTEAVSAPAHELRMLALLLEQLENERFTSARMIRLAGELKVEGTTASRRIKRLTRLIELLDSSENMFFRPLAAMLLWNAQFAMAVEAWRVACGPHIGQWIAAVGEFETLCSFSAYAFERPDATFPQLESAGPVFDADALRHPLIPAAVAVANDVCLGKSERLWIVSGSNMSGKSTLMRAVGLNTVLAWAGAPVACARLSISPLLIGASMSTHDSLADNRSRFYAEISRVRDVVELARTGHPTLFLLDELLSGTNSHDRRIGAEAVVRGLVERGAIGLVSTHDLALAEMVSTLDGRATNVHFEDHLEDGEIRFDYRLRQGVVTRSNALELMRAVGLDV